MSTLVGFYVYMNGFMSTSVGYLEIYVYKSGQNGYLGVPEWAI